MDNKREMLTGNAAAAWGARLAEVDYVPTYPITPQTEIIEKLVYWINNGEMDAMFVSLESEHSMITAAGAANVTGVRVFTATSSQGLLYGYEMLYIVAGWRAPFVMVNVSRGLSAPITLEPDHNDILSARDTGFLQIHCESCQEILDSILIAYKLAEDERVLLPVLVNFDGFHLSFTREPVEIPDIKEVRRFLPAYTSRHAFFKASQPSSQGVAVLGGFAYTYFKYQMHLASRNSLNVYKEIAGEFEDVFGRRHGVVEEFMMENAEYVLIMTNSFSTIGKAAVEKARAKGIRIGLLRIRMIRPFPGTDIQAALRGKKAVAVFDQNISVGKGGILFSEIAGCMYNERERPVLVSFIGGLGGKNVSPEEFEVIFAHLQKANKTGATSDPYLLYTKEEWDGMENLKKIAGRNG